MFDKNKLPGAELTRMVNERQVRTERRFEGTLTPQRGQNVWSFNLSTYAIKIEEPQTVGTDLLTGEILKKIIMDKDCLYCCAINRKNAERKFMKMITKMTAK
jgi:hypothetical protein